jgi:hypothetical protein
MFGAVSLASSLKPVCLSTFRTRAVVSGTQPSLGVCPRSCPTSPSSSANTRSMQGRNTSRWMSTLRRFSTVRINHPPDCERRFRIALHRQREADSRPAHFPGLPGDQPRRRAGAHDAVRGKEGHVVTAGVCEPSHLRPQRQRTDLRFLGGEAIKPRKKS